MQNSRREAVFILARWLATRDFPDRMIPAGLDRAFIMDLVYTTVRHYRTLIWVLEPFVKKMPQAETQALLLVGLAQLFFMKSVADYAAVNETVNAAKLTSSGVAGLVNGVLRNALRQRAAIEVAILRAPAAVRWSYPDALIARWTARFGATETEALCAWHNAPAETFLAYPGGRFEIVPRGMRVTDVPGFDAGTFIVQDPATALAIELMDVRPGLRVLDACAAPGGKTVQLAWRMQAQGTLVALDLHEDRLVTVRDNLARTHQTWVDVRCGDFATGIGEMFDRVLLDAPCSNTGVLRRRPDARWRWSEQRVAKLAKKQAELLDAAVTCVAEGGRLVYSTCSNDPVENQKQIAAFLKRHPTWHIVDEGEKLPMRDATDGAYACALMQG